MSDYQLSLFLSLSLYLFVNLPDPPHSVNYSSEQTVQTGKSIKLHCYFDGNPKPEVHWYQIDPRTGQHHRIDMPSDNNQILYITNATYSHEGIIMTSFSQILIIYILDKIDKFDSKYSNLI